MKARDDAQSAPQAARDRSVIFAPPAPRERDDGAHHDAFADAFRAGAILAVIASHLLPYYGFPHAEVLGVWGVNAFFVLSGFLLSGPYIRAILSPVSIFPPWRTFALRRFLRIYPLYAVAVIATAAPFLLGRDRHDTSLANVTAHLAMLHGFIPRYAQAAFNVPLWTMAVDAQFYVVLPVAAYVVVRMARSRDRAVRMGAVIATLVFCVVLSLVVRSLVYRFTPALTNVGFDTVFARNVVGLGSAFAFGIAIALAKIEGVKPSRRASLGLVALAIFATAALAVVKSRTPHIVLVIPADFFGAVAAAALLYGLGQSTIRYVQVVSKHSLTAFLASIAYALYLFHKPFSLLALHLLKHRFHAPSLQFGIAVSTITVGCTIPVAVFAHRFIEEPFLRLKAGVERRPAVAVPLS